jgi:hypothetical protein
MALQGAKAVFASAAALIASVQGATMILPSVSAGVTRIFDSVMGALLLNPDRSFVIADMVSRRAAVCACSWGAVALFEGS